MTSVPDVVGVVGGGRMGIGIAHAFLIAGATVVVLERNAPLADAASASLGRAIDASIARKTTPEGREILLGRASATADIADLAPAGLVLEAVPEDLALKLETLSRVESVTGQDAWLCSNTSSLSIDLLAESLGRPERFCGLHFFNPVPRSALVEIVSGHATSADLIESARGWVEALGKTPIVVTDSPGFASSRLGVVIALEAMRMLEDGVATAEDIDAAMVLGYRFPVGPLRLTDMVGLDVRLGIAEYLESAIGPRFAAPDILRRLVAEGRLGRKTGEGFFLWNE